MEIYSESRHWTTNYEVIPSTANSLSDARCVKCSICFKCLAGEETVMQEGVVYCWHCFQHNHAFKCVSCSKIITGKSKMAFIGYNNQVWHPDCFRCSNCRRFLVGQQLSQDGRYLYCWRCRDKKIFMIG